MRPISFQSSQHKNPASTESLCDADPRVWMRLAWSMYPLSSSKSPLLSQYLQVRMTRAIFNVIPRMFPQTALSADGFIFFSLLHFSRQSQRCSQYCRTGLQTKFMKNILCMRAVIICISWWKLSMTFFWNCPIHKYVGYRQESCSSYRSFFCCCWEGGGVSYRTWSVGLIIWGPGIVDFSPLASQAGRFKWRPWFDYPTNDTFSILGCSPPPQPLEKSYLHTWFKYIHSKVYSI